ncbi:hypothetical protein [Butyrivibrio fibrisolvens]|uniref:Glycosyltransferase RgtA/B/C/D-like domain-containing protein n=2 Tax=Butyrivibrio fibrisolvens TaxID=831 RepID=A0A317FYJ4_BUTFI|nr:hypothetical protein [Butyrivibrio fibrisolvens]PWT26307.1 hypothetical protein CPT75_03810 [Butyrivibrio fibrisolvens]
MKNDRLRDKVYSKLKKFQPISEQFLFPILLLIFPFVSIDQGLDISDTLYSLGNYEFYELMDTNWKLSIIIPSAFGHLLTFLPGAGTVLGMKIYTTLVISAMALLVYYGLKTVIPGWMLFTGEWIAESVCWCPSAILYNYMTYFFMTFGILFLLSAIMTAEGAKQKRRLFLAGVLLGINVAVRLPNVLEAGFILVLWFADFLEKKKLRDSVRSTIVCIGGYVTGAGVCICGTVLAYGLASYGAMINWLFGIANDSQSTHGTSYTLRTTIEAYGHTFNVMIIMIPCIVAGVILFKLRFKKVWMIRLAKILYIIGIFVLVRYYFAEGVFTTNYYYYDSMFQAAMMFIILSGVMDVLDIISGIMDRLGYVSFMPGTNGERIFAMVSILIILITPLGSDNYTFPLVNNLILVAPITLTQLRRVIRRSRGGAVHFPWHAMALMVVVVLLIQGTLFKYGFSFIDGMDGTRRDIRMSSEIPKAAGIETTTDNAVELIKLYNVLKDNGLLEYKLLQFGNAPGMSYLFDMEPAIYTTWPMLASNRIEDFDHALMNMTDYPVIVTDADIDGVGYGVSDKLDILMDYIASNDYNIIFEDEKYVVYAIS